MAQFFENMNVSNFYLDALHLIPELIWISGSIGDLVFLNSSATAYFGSSDKINRWEQFIHAEDRIEWFDAGNTLITLEPRAIICRLRDREGRYQWFELHIAAWPGDNEGAGEENWLFSARSIDDYKSRELVLREKLETQTAMLNASIDCIKVILPNGRVRDMNRSGCMALGVPIDSNFGMEWMGLLPRDVRDSGNEALASARAGTIGRFPGRSEIPGEQPRHWDNVLTPVMNEKGETNIILCLSRDVTVERELEQRLRHHSLDLEDKVKARSAELARLWDTSLDLLMVLDFAGNVVRTNPAWTNTLGHSDKAIVGQQFCSFVTDEDQSLCGKLLLDERLGASQPTEVRHHHLDNSIRWISWFAVRGEGEIYLTGRHVTAAKEAELKLRKTEDALRHAQKVESLGKLVGNVAHDFNNLLSAMKNSLALLKSPNCSATGARRYVDILTSTTEKAITICRQLLDFARRTPLNPEIFCVVERLEALRGMFAMICGGGIRIDIEIAERPLYISADPGQFDAALVNLVTNAAHAMRTNGSLTISVSFSSTACASWRKSTRNGRFAAVSVIDTGEGIPENIRDEIFEPFFTTKEAGIGTGLGLSQVYGFAEHSGGTVGVKSTIGIGTSVTLYLPTSTALASDIVTV